MALARVSGRWRERHLGVWLRHRLLANADLDKFWVFVRPIPRIPRPYVRPGIPNDW